MNTSVALLFCFVALAFSQSCTLISGPYTCNDGTSFIVDIDGSDRSIEGEFFGCPFSGVPTVSGDTITISDVECDDDLFGSCDDFDCEDFALSNVLYSGACLNFSGETDDGDFVSCEFDTDNPVRNDDDFVNDYNDDLFDDDGNVILSNPIDVSSYTFSVSSYTFSVSSYTFSVSSGDDDEATVSVSSGDDDDDDILLGDDDDESSAASIVLPVVLLAVLAALV